MRKSTPTPTPGPWIALRGVDGEPHRWGVFQAVADRPNYHIASVENGAPGDTLKTEEANARLFAAAPDLLALLVEARSWVDGDEKIFPREQDICNRIDAAIAKARGETR